MTVTSTRPIVGITASFTPQLLIRPMLTAAVSLGEAEVLVADYNQVHQSLLDLESAFGNAPDRIVVLWRMEDMFGPALTDWVVEACSPASLLDDVRHLGALVALAARNGVPLIASIPPVPHFAWLDALDTRTSVRMTVLHGQLVAAFVEGLGDAPVTLVDLAALVRSHGASRTYDTRNDLMYHQPFTSAFARVFGELLGEALDSVTTSVPKVLAVDADNTLWGGIVGEDGADGILVGDSFPGNAYRSLQQGLIYQAANGALLALVSKNNQRDADEVFERRAADMVLGPGHFAARRVDWNSKADNLWSVAEELNLDVDSFVFVDDNDVELEEIRQRVPGIHGVKVSDEPADIAELSASLKAFRFAKVSHEDRERTAMMQLESDRKQAAARAPSREEFLESLDLTVRVFPAAAAHVGRVTQLINKTNQFNLTTVRRDEAEVAKLIASAAHGVYAVEVTDRFGGYGLVGVAVVARTADAWDIDTFLMSCRVLGRGVEDAILQCIADDAAESGATALRGRYVRTPKNGQVARFYADRGFRKAGDDLSEAELPMTLDARHVTILRDA